MRQTTTRQVMAMTIAMKRECQRLLKAHGLALRWLTGFSYAEKLIGGASIAIRKKGDSFTIIVAGKGTWRKYFEREATVLKASLSKYGDAKVDLI